MNTRTKVLLMTLAVAFPSSFALASSHDVDVVAMMKALQQRIAALEARQTFTSFMPDLAERFHVLHRAGEAGDWAVASHELEEMKRLTDLSTSIDSEKGKLMQGMMAPSFQALDAAVDHADSEKFGKALTQTINTCNACHTATDSEFIQVTLDARDALSLRHPHKFMERDVPGEHGHGMSMDQAEGMPELPASD